MRNVAVTDVNTTTPFCFEVPLTPILSCALNNRVIYGTSSSSNVSISEFSSSGIVMINDWSTVHLDHRHQNQLECEAGEPSVLSSFYGNFYSLSKLVIMFIVWQKRLNY